MYESADWPVIEEWLAWHESSRVHRALLPPVGIIVDDGAPCVALWCHLSVNIGVAFLDAPVSRPGMNLAAMLAAFAFGLDAIEAICREHDYNVIVANTLPPIARLLERRHGFVRDGDRVQLTKLLN